MNSAKSDLSPAEESIAAVVVTFNRLTLLQEAVQALRAQTRKVNEIIVINNGSTDATGAWLANQPDLTVISQANSGGAGGFYSGIKAAHQNGHDWIWCMDDDCIPESQALEALTTTPYFRQDDTAFLASKVMDGEGKIPSAGHVAEPIGADTWVETVRADGCYRTRLATFVSIMVSRKAVTIYGLPIKEFFIWFDDFEYSDRITQSLKGYFVLPSVVRHKTTIVTTVDLRDPKTVMKYKYGLRNQVAWRLRRVGSGVLTRWIEVYNIFAYYARMVLKRKASPALLVWLLKGIFFRYRIEFPKAPASQ